MKDNKIKRLVSLILSVFLISLIFTLIDSYPWNKSAYDLGHSTGLMMRHLIEILAMFGMMILIVNTFKIEKLILLILTAFCIVFTISLFASYPWDNMSSYDFGRSVGHIFSQAIKIIILLGWLVSKSKLFRLENNKT